MLFIERVRSCSQKARDCMVLYKEVEASNLDSQDGICNETFMNKHAILEDSIKSIEN